MDGATVSVPGIPAEHYLILLVAWAVFVILGAYVANEKGRPQGEAIILALIFGPFGVLIAALLPTLEGKKKSWRLNIETSPSLPVFQRDVAPKAATNDLFGVADAERLLGITIDDYRHLIDWSPVLTEADEPKARKAAMRKYVSLHGPKLEVLSWTKEGAARCKCVCGAPAQIPKDQAGKVVVCPSCKTYILAPQKA